MVPSRIPHKPAAYVLRSIPAKRPQSTPSAAETALRAALVADARTHAQRIAQSVNIYPC